MPVRCAVGGPRFTPAVACGRNSLLPGEHPFADRAVAAGCQAFRSTGGGYGRVFGNRVLLFVPVRSAGSALVPVLCAVGGPLRIPFVACRIKPGEDCFAFGAEARPYAVLRTGRRKQIRDVEIAGTHADCFCKGFCIHVPRAVRMPFSRVFQFTLTFYADQLMGVCVNLFPFPLMVAFCHRVRNSRRCSADQHDRHEDRGQPFPGFYHRFLTPLQ